MFRFPYCRPSHCQINVFVGLVEIGDDWGCFKIHGFVYQIEKVDQFISDPRRKLIVYTLPSIWYYPFFKNDFFFAIRARPAAPLQAQSDGPNMMGRQAPANSHAGPPPRPQQSWEVQ